MHKDMLFSDQVKILSNWFKNWNECEQTVALFSLLKRVQKTQAKFLARCLEHGLRDCVELEPIEEEANDAGFIGRLLHEPQQEQVIAILLSHLPLLRPGNSLARSRYLKLLPKVLAFAVERSEYLEESRQLLSYSLIHPAFDNDERKSLTSWMRDLDDRLPGNNSSKNGDLKTDGDENHNKLWKDDPTLPKPPESQISSPPWQLNDNGLKSESSTVSLSPGHRYDDTDQHQHSDTFTATEETVVAEYDFNPWLKSLRLHKYTDFFNRMKYDEMLQLTDEKLSKNQVTKGARDKILLNIKKLHERFEMLQSLEKEIPGGGSLRNALTEMKSMISTPIICFEPTPESMSHPDDPTPAQAKNMIPATNEIQLGDIPGQFTKVMGKACTQLLISRPDKDNITLYMQLLERCMQHDAFTSQQKKRLSSWKQQTNKMYCSLPRNQQLSSQRSVVGVGYPNKRVTGRSLPSFGIGARMTSPVASPPLQASNSLSMFSPQVPKPNWYGSGYGSNTHPTPHATVQHPVEDSRKTASLDPKLVQRPPYPQTGDVGYTGTSNQPGHGDTDISNRLDSLSLSVAEQALPDGDHISTI